MNENGKTEWEIENENAHIIMGQFMNENEKIEIGNDIECTHIHHEKLSNWNGVTTDLWSENELLLGQLENTMKDIF